MRDIRKEPGVQGGSGKLCSFAKAFRCDAALIALALPSGG